MKKLNEVLLVEDDLVDVMTVKRAFRDLGIQNEIIHKSDGEKALDYLLDKKNPRPGIILLDLNMPCMNGLEFLEIVKKNTTLQSIPIVVLTTSSESNDLTTSFKHSIAGYMIKPVNYTDYVEMMKAISSYWNQSEMI